MIRALVDGAVVVEMAYQMTSLHTIANGQRITAIYFVIRSAFNLIRSCGIGGHCGICGIKH